MAQRKAVLDRLAQFLFSAVARYQFALFGRLWQTDRARMEIRDLLKITTPSIDFFLSDAPDLVVDDKGILAAMDTADIMTPLHDYMEHRAQFENGLCPQSANKPQKSVPENYINVLKATLQSSLGSLVLDCHEDMIDKNEARILVQVQYPLPVHPESQHALESFQFYDSAIIDWVTGSKEIVITKPLGELYFTVERAYSDALKTTNLLLVAS